MILLGDNLPHLRELEDGAVQMVYADPPFNTGRTQARKTLATVAAADGDRTGFGGRRYATTLLSESSYRDTFEDYLAFLEPRLTELRRVLSPEGTLYLHLDYREAHYAKLLLDELFGRECFLNELIWAYDYGAKPRTRWPQKHDTILVYVRDPDALPLRRRGGRPRAVHGPRPRHPRAARARQAADQRDVAHDRLPHRPREDRLPDAEAGGASSGASCRPPRAPATCAWTRSPDPARSARSRPSSAAATC